ncbi:hypothetical protein D3C86_2148270 [compost metagenome]
MDQLTIFLAQLGGNATWPTHFVTLAQDEIGLSGLDIDMLGQQPDQRRCCSARAGVFAQAHARGEHARRKIIAGFIGVRVKT